MFKKLIDGYHRFQRFKALNQQKFPVAFYSEMGSDRIYFEEMITRLLTDHHQPVLYLTSSEKDPMLAYPHPDFHPLYIGAGTLRNLAFRDLNVKVFVMTLPDLETYELKRSVNPVHYVYVFHSLVSTHMIYRDKAFDAYDTIFCVGPHHEVELREAEQLFGLKEKTFVPHGYPRIDKIMADYQSYLQTATSSADKYLVDVLIAPSWGENSITNQCLHPVIQILLDNGYKVTFRPHPMTGRDEPKRIEQVQEAFADNNNFQLDLDIANPESLYRSDIMISDWSGVALEFSLVTEKPVLFIDIPRKMNNKNFGRFQAVPVEVSLREQLGGVVSPDHLEQLPLTLAQLLKQPPHTIADIRSQLIYNIGNSSEVGAAQIAAIANAHITGQRQEFRSIEAVGLSQ